MNLMSLSLFVTVAEERNIARAAARRNIAASAVSKRMLDLELEHGAPLLVRHTRGVGLTDAGEALVRHARNLLGLVERIEAEMNGYAAGTRGHVRLAANPSAITQFLPELLAGFMAQYPRIEISLTEATTSLSLNMLQDGLADLAIVGWGPDHPAVAYEPFRTDDLALAVPVGHELTQSAPPVPFISVLDFDMIGLGVGASINARLQEAAAAAGRSLRLKLLVASFDGVRRMVEAGLGVAVLPVSAIKPYCGPLGIAMIPLADAWKHRTLRLATRIGHPLSGSSELLRRYMIGTQSPPGTMRG